MSAELVFRIIYRVLYFCLFLILLALLFVTPGDIIRQALPAKQSYLILLIAICYFITVALVAFIYATRLYINRSVLASIPKSWIPIEKGDVNKDVRDIIAASLSRSAAIAFEARPRVNPPVSAASVDGQEQEKHDGQAREGRKSFLKSRSKKPGTGEGGLGITLPPHMAVWGEIEHYGWASPDSPDLPNLQYSTVISELPNLIEAKAIALAPPDANESEADPPTLDPEAVALLQRDENMGLREYLAHLAELRVLAVSPGTTDFIALYEYARFSTRALSNTRFRELMHLFADLLRSMQPLDPELLLHMLGSESGSDDDGGGDLAPEESDIDNDAPLRTNPTTPRSDRSRASLRSQGSQHSREGGGNVSHSGTSSTGGSGSRTGQPVRNSSVATWRFRTAPTTPRSRGAAVSRSSSVGSFAQTRRPYDVGQAGGSSASASLRSSASAASVIRLSERAAGSDEMPYVLTLGDV